MKKKKKNKLALAFFYPKHCSQNFETSSYLHQKDQKDPFPSIRLLFRRIHVIILFKFDTKNEVTTSRMTIILS